MTIETTLVPTLPDEELAPAVDLEPASWPVLCPVCRVPLHLPTEEHEHEREERGGRY